MRLFKAFAAVLSALALCAAVSAHTFAAAYEAESGVICVEKIEFQRDDFVRGMDISSVISLENAGVSFRTEGGEEKDIFALLSENGVNYIRARVWNDPYDENGRGYGGGNSDLEKAGLIGRRAAENGMKLMVDFHYSDFWADPGKQREPKAWAGFSLEQKEKAVYDWTLDSLLEIKNAGAEIGMVQIGNEITSGIAGEYSGSGKALLLRSAAEAVRAFDSGALVVCHFTNPEKTETIKWFADYLSENGVDYDVFATSYYPGWHGSLGNLTSVLNYAAEIYGKLAMVAETSYPYTLEDSDGHANTISRHSNSTGENMLWAFTPQGQAEAVREVMNAVNSVSGGKGLGVFYWEGAWITAGDISGLSGDAYTRQYNANKELWESFGCGWASSYAGEYDGEAALYCGGSAVDNQAFFDSQGKALPSLEVFKAVLTGCCGVIKGDADGDGAVTVKDVTEIQRYIAELAEFTEKQLKAADADGNGAVDIADATLLQRYLAEFIDKLPT